MGTPIAEIDVMISRYNTVIYDDLHVSKVHNSWRYSVNKLWNATTMSYLPSAEEMLAR